MPKSRAVTSRNSLRRAFLQSQWLLAPNHGLCFPALCVRTSLCNSRFSSTNAASTDAGTSGPNLNSELTNLPALPGQRAADTRDIFIQNLDATLKAHRLTNLAANIRYVGSKGRVELSEQHARILAATPETTIKDPLYIRKSPPSAAASEQTTKSLPLIQIVKYYPQTTKFVRSRRLRGFPQSSSQSFPITEHATNDTKRQGLPDTGDHEGKVRMPEGQWNENGRHPSQSRLPSHPECVSREPWLAHLQGTATDGMSRSVFLSIHMLMLFSCLTFVAA